MIHSRTGIYSIYSQIENVVAEEMAKEGHLNLIPFDQMPATQQFNEKDEKAYCAIVIADSLFPQFQKRCADLRA